LALRCLKTNRNNIICIYHHNTHSGKKYDGSPSADFKVTGVEEERKVKVKSKAITGSKPKAGYLHCGCSEEIALLDFFFWKTWTASNSKGDVEGLLQQRIEPRPRLFFAQYFMKMTGLKVDDLYTHGKKPEEVKKRILCTQISYLQDQLAALAMDKDRACESQITAARAWISLCPSLTFEHRLSDDFVVVKIPESPIHFFLCSGKSVEAQRGLTNSAWWFQIARAYVCNS
jgi:hypothetical protein